MGEAGACSARLLDGFTAADACGLREVENGEGLWQQEQGLGVQAKTHHPLIIPDNCPVDWACLFVNSGVPKDLPLTSLGRSILQRKRTLPRACGGSQYEQFYNPTVLCI